MKIEVYFTHGDILSCEDVKNLRQFWRVVSKHCKRISKYYSQPERVIKVKKEVNTNENNT